MYFSLAQSSIILLLLCLVAHVTSTPPILTQQQHQQYWYTHARTELHTRVHRIEPQHHRAKNTIIFLGDGMSLSTITASRILKGQLRGQPGEESTLEFDTFPHSALIKTYNLDRQVPDSAGTATAYLTGVKANFYTLGLNGHVVKDEPNCHLVNQSAVSSILQWALDQGKSAGLVTTTRVTHATPAASYAHSQNRDWEYEIPPEMSLKDGHLCKDIARQLIEDEPGRSLNVILGGGRYCFTPTTQLDPKGMKLATTGQVEPVYGKRTDNRNLIEEWIELRKAESLVEGAEFAYVNSTKGLLDLDYSNLSYLFGLFNHTNMEYDMLRDRSDYGEPSLTQMTEAAIRVLSNNPNGFVLLVEGGRIDHAHHDGFATLALHETLEFERAIKMARTLVPEDETLIVVTADHSHSMVINGYPERGNRIQQWSQLTDGHGIQFTTLMYANGPGFRTMEERRLAAQQDGQKDLDELKYRVHSAIYLPEANHAGEDVTLYAIGPMSHMFGGTHEQSYIAHVMAYASCIAFYQHEPHCHAEHRTTGQYRTGNTAIAATAPSIATNIIMLLLIAIIMRV